MGIPLKLKNTINKLLTKGFVVMLWTNAGVIAFLSEADTVVCNDLEASQTISDVHTVYSILASDTSSAAIDFKAAAEVDMLVTLKQPIVLKFEGHDIKFEGS